MPRTPSQKTEEKVMEYIRDFIGRYIKTGVIEELDVKSSRYSIKPATCYCYKRQSHRG